MRFIPLIFLGIALISSGNAAPAVSNPYDSGVPAKAASRIDELVLAKIGEAGFKPANLCTDAVFIRRVFLDMIGTLPTAEEAKNFIADKAPDKRRLLVEQLFQREEFADYWTLKWCDLLRVKAEFPINLWPNAAQAYHRWIHTAVRENMSYDTFVRELLTSNGSNFRVAQVNFYRAMQNKDATSIAKLVALNFMGCRAELWPAARLGGTAAFFAQINYKATGEWKEEIVHFDAAKKIPAELPAATFPDGVKATFAPNQDPRVVFADWLINPKNPWFCRAIVNRAWYWFMGRGLVHEPDDIRGDNPPSHPELLAYLEQQLHEHGYDLRYLFRLILNSQIYQLSSVPSGAPRPPENLFASYALRRFEAEVLIDAINQVTGTNEKYSSPIPEPFTFLPDDQRSIALPDGSITSSFLELFGKSARDTGLESERNNRITAGQRLHLLNSSHIRRKIESGPHVAALLKAQGKPRDTIDNIYLTLLSRYPTEAEMRLISKSFQAKKGVQRDQALDIIWALINSMEFSYRH